MIVPAAGPGALLHAGVLWASSSPDAIVRQDVDNVDKVSQVGQVGHVSQVHSVQEWLAVRAPVNAVDDATGETPLHRAVAGGNPLLVAFLVQNGADLFLGDKNGCTPLMLSEQQYSNAARVINKIIADVQIANY